MSDSECIFCKIIAGEIPCAKVYEDDNVLSFLDIAPVQPGHALVIPKAHAKNLFDLDDDAGLALMRAMKKVGRAVMEATDAHGLNVGMNNYEAAGQLVMHAHFHLIPRFEGDGLQLWEQTPYGEPEAMIGLAEKIAAAIK